MAVVAVSSCSDKFLEDKKNYDQVTSEAYEYYRGANGRLNDIYSWCLPAVSGLTWKYPSMGTNDDAAKSTEEYTGFSIFVDPENELSRHCDAVMDGLMKLIACYVPPKVREEDCQGRAVHMAAVSRGDTAKRRSGLHDSSSCSQGLSLSPVGGCHA